MNRQIRAKKLLVQLNTSLLVAQSKFNPSKREIRLLVKIYSAGDTAYSSCMLSFSSNYTG